MSRGTREEAQKERAGERNLSGIIRNCITASLAVELLFAAGHIRAIKIFMTNRYVKPVQSTPEVLLRHSAEAVEVYLDGKWS